MSRLQPELICMEKLLHYNYGYPITRPVSNNSTVRLLRLPFRIDYNFIMASPLDHELRAPGSRLEEDASSSSSLSDIDSSLFSTPVSMPSPGQRHMQSPLSSRQRRVRNRRSPLSSRQKLHATLKLWRKCNTNIKGFLRAWVGLD